MPTILDHLIEENEFPVVFIGAGISKRFLIDYPDWVTLLKEFWDKTGLGNFYGELNKLRDQIKTDSPEYTDKEIEHYTNIKAGTILEEAFNANFNDKKITIPNFSTERAFETKISPFKKAVAERFSTYSLREGSKEEYKSFKRMLSKTQIILTTNYDRFIESSYNENSNYEITKYIGQKGFFKETHGFAEIYKLHGCADSPADVIITEKDYNNFEKNSVLISSKIISMMMHSPIIFIGYSLTDINVRKIIKEFTRSLTDEEIMILEKRLILIEWQKGESDFVEEVINDRDLGCKLKVIKTDNYKELFNKISLINQGIAPTEVRKYQHVFKKIIIDSGKKGILNSVLMSIGDLDRLERDLQDKNITVALGDAKYIFQIPDIISYSLDYISDKDEISTDIRMRFALIQSGRFPINKILDSDLINNSTLHPTEKEKLKQKVQHYSNIKEHYSRIVPSSVIIKNATSVAEITSYEVKKEKIYETISYNIDNLNSEDLKDFIIQELMELKDRGEIKIVTEFRRLMLIYDIVKYGKKHKKSNA